MYITKRIKAFLKGWKNQPSKSEVDRLFNYYRRKIFRNEALKLLKKEDFNNLIHVARYADFGVWTAVEAAFCLGYEARKAVWQHGKTSHTDGRVRSSH